MSGPTSFTVETLNRYIGDYEEEIAARRDERQRASESFKALDKRLSKLHNERDALRKTLALLFPEAASTALAACASCYAAIPAGATECAACGSSDADE